MAAFVVLRRERPVMTAIGGGLLATGGFPAVGYLCLGAVVFSSVAIALFMRQPKP